MVGPSPKLVSENISLNFEATFPLKQPFAGQRAFSNLITLAHPSNHSPGAMCQPEINQVKGKMPYCHQGILILHKFYPLGN